MLDRKQRDQVPFLLAELLGVVCIIIILLIVLYS
jgi:hypothetical protein